MITEIEKCDYKINDKRRESNFPRTALSGRAGNTLFRDENFEQSCIPTKIKSVPTITAFLANENVENEVWLISLSAISIAA